MFRPELAFQFYKGNNNCNSFGNAIIKMKWWIFQITEMYEHEENIHFISATWTQTIWRHQHAMATIDYTIYHTYLYYMNRNRHKNYIYKLALLTKLQYSSNKWYCWRSVLVKQQKLLRRRVQKRRHVVFFFSLC